jgi:hypothetical protein
MATTVVRVDKNVHAKLLELSRERSISINQVITDLIESESRERFWQEMKAGYDRLAANPGAMEAYQEEIQQLEGGSMDGLEDEEPYYSPEELEQICAEDSRSVNR